MSDCKGLICDSGMVFLQNDSNSFLEWLSGEKSWSVEQLEAARSVLNERYSLVRDLGAEYIKFIVPEKSVVYNELLLSQRGGGAEAASYWCF